jgi:hypothetical protein
MKVFCSKTALSQLKTIAEADSISTSRKLSNTILDRTIVLENFPEMGTIQDFDSNHKIFIKHQYRYLLEGNYKILYFRTSNSYFLDFSYKSRT